MSYRILRLPEVLQKVGLSRATVYNRMSQKQFPLSVSLGGNTVGWIESELDSWLAEQIKKSRERSSDE